MKTNTILQGDALTKLRELPEKSINMCLTSPPYWALRDYGTEVETIWEIKGEVGCEHDFELEVKKDPMDRGGRGDHDSKNGGVGSTWEMKTNLSGFCNKCGAWKGQLGLEPTFDLYIKHLCDIFDEVKRVLRDDGTCWVNLGDTYYGSGKGAGGDMDKSKEVYQIPKGWKRSSRDEYNKVGMKKNCLICDKEFLGKENSQFCSRECLNKQGNDFRSQNRILPDKCLTMIPQRFAIEMCKRRGFIIPDERDRAWLAGIIEGEGCIHIHNTNKKMIDKVVQLTRQGNNLQTTEKDRNHKLYRWNSMSDNAKKILREVYPYLVTKRNQARCALFCSSSGKDAEECWINIKNMHNYKEVSRYYPEPKIEGIYPWILRNVIIWKKPNCMPSSVKDRFTVDFEYIFFFSKKKKYYFETQYESLAPISMKDRRKDKGRFEYDGKRKNAGEGIQNAMCGINSKGRNKRCVWKIPPKPFSEAHFAVYPEELCETPIKAGCPEGGIILDPFFGAGTTGLVALKQNKKFIGIELSSDYCKIANSRIKPYLEQTKIGKYL